ncbi:hypothetical protein [Aureimonas jatrophae]|uniref:Uncharacterized protein n=1 Tax=Aureimonas jatrophae TaxID=1166073 RepID=A0A1H0D3I9_9HYPH|nr:hypothetical protein [Aureimonas jatrophae]MBB3951689.1 hypothetical protein [Aureimonas jatrophae]SDN64697.1 hypothetical protein SAMN05192530_101581 [Aureimonas jatrophae]
MSAVIQNDHDLIDAIDSLMRRMHDLGLPTRSMQGFYDVGEWLLCFEGAWMMAKDDPAHPLRREPSYQAIERYFADELA